VLVLLATNNGEKWILGQIKSILNQKNIDIDILISDDGSTDNTISLIKNKYKNKKNISFIKRSKVCRSSGANFKHLLTYCNAYPYQYIALSDQDDLWYNDKILRGIELLERSKYSGYSSAVLSIWQNYKNKLLTQSSKFRYADFLFEGAGQGCTFILPIKNFIKIQKFCIMYEDQIKDIYYHDWLIYLLTRSFGGSWFFDQRASMLYRQHQNNDTGSRGTFLSTIKRLEKIKNGWYKKQISIALRIYFLATVENSNLIFNFSKFFKQKDSMKRRLLMTKFVWLYGRRRSSDRCILILASILGYI
jgi:rhamnosyltransferase